MKNNKADKGAGVRERLCRSLDISPDIFPYGIHVDIRGRNAVTLKGILGVVLYGDAEMRFAFGEGEVYVKGKRLCCSTYKMGEAIVDGCIEAVGFEEREE